MSNNEQQTVINKIPSINSKSMVFCSILSLLFAGDVIAGRGDSPSYSRDKSIESKNSNRGLTKAEERKNLESQLNKALEEEKDLENQRDTAIALWNKLQCELYAREDVKYRMDVSDAVKEEWNKIERGQDPSTADLVKAVWNEIERNELKPLKNKTLEKRIISFHLDEINESLGILRGEVAAAKNKVERLEEEISKLPPYYTMTDEKFDEWMNAVECDDIKTVESFIKEGINVDETRSKEGPTALWKAVFNYATGGRTRNKMEIIKTLVNNGADVNFSFYGLPIFNSLFTLIRIQNWDIEILDLLLAKGADPNKCTLESPLMALINTSCSDNEIFKVLQAMNKLLEYGADPNLKDYYGRTALMMAAEKGNLEIVKLLLTPNFVNPIISLISAGKYKQAVDDKTIRKTSRSIRRANANIQDNDGKTALMYVLSRGMIDARANHIEIVKLLLKYGANPNLKDKRGKTTLDYAKGTENTEIIKLIEDAIQKNNAVAKK